MTTSVADLARKVRRLDVLVRQLQSRSSISSLLTLGVFGDGSDGRVILDGSQDFGFATRVGSTYTLTRDIYASALTIGPGVTVVPAGCRFFVRGGTLRNDGTIAAVGLAGAASGLNPANPSAASPPVGVGNSVAQGGSFGSAGAFGAGNGGAGGAGSSGAGGGIIGTGSPGSYLRLPIHALAGSEGGLSMGGTTGGGGRGGNGGGDGTNSGGNGGNGAGMIVIFAQAVVNNGYFIATGGAGRTTTVGNTGGGGGGGGGVVVAYTLQPWTAGSTDVSGGAAGGGSGTGTAGSPGAQGTVLNVVLA
jgi:hypothetical protein